MRQATGIDRLRSTKAEQSACSSSQSREGRVRHGYVGRTRPERRVEDLAVRVVLDDRQPIRISRFHGSAIVRVAADRVGPASRGGAFDALGCWLGHVFSIPDVASNTPPPDRTRTSGRRRRTRLLPRATLHSSSTSSPAIAVAVRRPIDEGPPATHRKTRDRLTCSGRTSGRSPQIRQSSELPVFTSFCGMNRNQAPRLVKSAREASANGNMSTALERHPSSKPAAMARDPKRTVYRTQLKTSFQRVRSLSCMYLVSSRRGDTNPRYVHIRPAHSHDALDRKRIRRPETSTADASRPTQGDRLPQLGPSISAIIVSSRSSCISFHDRLSASAL